VEGFVLGLASPLLLQFCMGGALILMSFAAVQHFWQGSQSTPDLNLTTEAGSLRDGTVPWVACRMRGWRPAMEDSHVVEMLDPSVCGDAAIFAVLDGHGGAEVSALAAKLLRAEVEAVCREHLQRAPGCNNDPATSSTDSAVPNGKSPAAAAQKPMLAEALAEALPRLDARIRAGPLRMGGILPTVLHPFVACGSTACVAIVDFKTREVLVANVGDSRAMFVRKGKAMPLSEDHKPELPKERNRIRLAGGKVVKCGPCHRVDGNLNLSRALGDFHLKMNFDLPPQEQKVIAVPDCTETPYVGGDQELLVLGCDGLFEKCSNQDVADIIWSRRKQAMSMGRCAEELLIACCARGVRGNPIEEGTDNETVIIIQLPPQT